MNSLGALLEWCPLAQVNTQGDVALYGMAVILAFLLLFSAFTYVWWLKRKENCLCPYTGLPLRHAASLPFFSKEKVAKFLADMHQYDNRVFLFKKAAFCRETGRIFPNCVNWLDIIFVDWKFIRKRYPGVYVSWGSLSEEQRSEIMAKHQTLDGFQLGVSSPSPSPMKVEPEYAFSKPGPLYVDINTGVLVGWKCVPETELEVLVVQKPKKRKD